MLCPSCREPLPDRARFCPRCGAAVGDGAPEPTDALGVGTLAERRHLTVVFCDLVGSTELSTSIDAEEFSDLVQAYQQRAVSVAREYGGDVEGYSGDGILFRFGWPEAHEDDADRALRACLDIVDAMAEFEHGHRLEVRLGVHTGLVVVGEMGATGRRATMALGETLNLAARLQAVADPGTVVASAPTMALVEGLYLTESLGTPPLKGIAYPVEAFRVVRLSGLRTRLEASRGRLTPLVDRHREVGNLLDRWRAAEGGEGTAIVVTGEPGVGKSRVVYQLRQSLTDVAHSWIECTCSSYTQMSALWPVVELIEQALQLQTEQDPAARLERLEQGLLAAGVDTPDALALVAGLLEIPGAALPPMSPGLRAERTLQVLVAWVLALSRLQPVVVVVEDLHWCDPTSLELLDRLVGRAPASSLLLIMTARPEFDEAWTTAVTSFRLQPFDDADTRKLVGALTGDRELPTAVVDRIVGSAGGIPLFAEEVGRTVLESDLLVVSEGRWLLAGSTTDFEIPQTLKASLLARLDRLGSAKTVAQLAAVIGRFFSFELLREVSGLDRHALADLLERLIMADLVFVDGEAPSDSYVFKHGLIQDIAYESLLRRTRRNVHDRIAHLLEARSDSGATVAPEVIARHFEAAGSIPEAAEHYQRAAAQAVERSAYREAIAFLRRGISLVTEHMAGEDRDGLEIQMQLALGSAIIGASNYADPELEAAYARARQLCEGREDDARVGMALTGLSIYYSNRGETDLGAELAERVLAIAEAQHDDTLELLGRVQLALARSYQGLAAVSLGHCLRAIEIYDPVRHGGMGSSVVSDQGVAAYCFAGWNYLMQGYLDRAVPCFEAAVELAESLGQPFNIVYALFFKATCHWERGESAETIQAASKAREMAEQQGFGFWLGLSEVMELGELITTTGDASPLPRLLEAGMEASLSGNRGGSTTMMARVAQAARAAGDVDTAMAVVEMAFAVSAETNQPWWDSTLHRMRAELICDRSEGDAAACEEAETEWLRSLQLASERGYPVHGLRAAIGYAAFLNRTGRGAEAARVLRRWYEQCPEGFDRPPLVAARAALAEVEGGLGRRRRDPSGPKPRSTGRNPQRGNNRRSRPSSP